MRLWLQEILRLAGPYTWVAVSQAAWLARLLAALLLPWELYKTYGAVLATYVARAAPFVSFLFFRDEKYRLGPVAAQVRWGRWASLRVRLRMPSCGCPSARSLQPVWHPGAPPATRPSPSDEPSTALANELEPVAGLSVNACRRHTAASTRAA
jgi:hypothetical protein